MGSGTSSQGNVIQIGDGGRKEDQGDDTPSSSQSSLRRWRSNSEPRQAVPTTRPPSNEGRRSYRRTKVTPIDEVTQIKQDLSLCKNKLSDALQREEQATARCKELEAQVSSLDSQLLDLREQVGGLQEVVEKQHEDQQVEETIVTTVADCPGTLQVRDSHILQLEAEMQAVKAEAAKMKTRMRKRLRITKAELTEAKHDSSLKLLDLKEEIASLKEEKQRYKESAANTTSNSTGISSMPSVDDGRTSIILDLSNQLSEQDQRITDLQQQLDERDSKIKELTSRSVAKSPRSVQRAKSMPSRGPCGKTLQFHSAPPEILEVDEKGVDESTNSKPTSSHLSLLTAKEDDPDMQELRAIARSMLKVHKKRRKARDAKPSDEDYRESSGVSRDSGVLSMEVDGDGVSHQKGKRPTSGTSTLSALSMEGEYGPPHRELSDWNSDSSDEEQDPLKGSSKTLDNLRTISAPKRKTKLSESEYIDKLLSTSETDLSGNQPRTSVKGKPPSCGRTSSMRSPRSPSFSMNGPGLFGTANNQMYTIGHL